MTRWACLCAMLVGCTHGATATAPPVPPPRALSEIEPVEISAAVLHGLLREGDVTLPGDVAHLPLGSLRYQICLDHDGAATTTPWPLHNPAHADLDRAIASRIANWRFRPLVRDGVAVAACANVTVWVGTLPPPGPPRPSADDALLPDARVELPRPTILRMARPSGVARPPTPGVGIVVRCARPGADDAPVATLVQASGDATADASALYAWQSRLVAEPASEHLRCTPVATIAGVTPPGRLAPPPPASPVAPPQDPPSAVVPPRAFEQRRMSGDPRILPSDAVKLRIAEAGVRELVIPLKVCVGVDGAVDGVTVLASSGFLSYDIELLNAAAGWRYQPFMLDGVPVPVCSIVEFVYRQKPAAG